MSGDANRTPAPYGWIHDGHPDGLMFKRGEPTEQEKLAHSIVTVFSAVQMADAVKMAAGFETKYKEAMASLRARVVENERLTEALAAFRENYEFILGHCREAQDLALRLGNEATSMKAAGVELAHAADQFTRGPDECRPGYWRLQSAIAAGFAAFGMLPPEAAPQVAQPLTDLLREAGELFRFYEQSHRAKGAGHEAKAKRNAEIAERIERVLGIGQEGGAA